MDETTVGPREAAASPPPARQPRAAMRFGGVVLAGGVATSSAEDVPRARQALRAAAALRGWEVCFDPELQHLVQPLERSDSNRSQLLPVARAQDRRLQLGSAASSSRRNSRHGDGGSVGIPEGIRAPVRQQVPVPGGLGGMLGEPAALGGRHRGLAERVHTG